MSFLKRKRNTAAGPLPRSSRVLFFRLLAAMVSAGLPLPRALHVIESTGGREETRLADFARRCRMSVEKGETFRDTLRNFGAEKISPFQLAVVRLGEESNLSECLHRLAEEEESSWRVQQRISSALLYPIFVFGLVTVFLFLFLPGFVFPHYLAMFDSLHIVSDNNLFAALLAFMQWTQGRGFWVPVALLLGVVLITARSKRVRNLLLRSLLLLFPNTGITTLEVMRRAGGEDEYFLAVLEAFLLRHIRPLGLLLQASWTARFARALEIVLRVNCGLLKGIKLAADASSSRLLSHMAPEMTLALQEGNSLAHSLSLGEALPPLFLQMVVVGEESGALPQLCDKAARFYEEQLEHSAQDALALLEPLLTGALGLLIGALVLIAMFPIAEVIRSL